VNIVLATGIINVRNQVMASRIALETYCAYNKAMRIIFDPRKDRQNLGKHGVSLADAGRFEWSTSVMWPDCRQDYGELRIAGLGYIGHRLHYIVFVERDDNRRIISLRKANIREIKRYAET